LITLQRHTLPSPESPSHPRLCTTTTTTTTTTASNHLVQFFAISFRIFQSIQLLSFFGFFFFCSLQTLTGLIRE
jgi:hypothetical protein